LCDQNESIDSQNESIGRAAEGGGGCIAGPIRFGIVDLLSYEPIIRAHSREHGRTLAYLEFTHAAPDGLASGVVLMTMPDGLQVAGIVVCYNRLIEKGNGSCDPADRSDRRWQTRLAPSCTP
jgi:hypothetical protein